MSNGNQDERTAAGIDPADGFSDSPYDAAFPSAEEGETLFQDLSIFLSELKDYAILNTKKQKDIRAKIDRLKSCTPILMLKKQPEFPIETVYQVYETVQGQREIWNESFSKLPVYILLLCLSPEQMSDAVASAFRKAKVNYGLISFSYELQKKHQFGKGIIRFQRFRRNIDNKMMLFLSRVDLTMTLFGYDSFDDIRCGGESLRRKCSQYFCRMESDERNYNVHDDVHRCRNSGETCPTSKGSTAVASSSRPANEPIMDEISSTSGDIRSQSAVEADQGMAATSASHNNREESLPKAAEEIDFDIFDPPRRPVVFQSTEPICESLADANDHDVLCFKGGRGFMNHSGNRRLTELVQDFLPTCSTANISEMSCLARTIVLIVRMRGGRFLRMDKDTGKLFEYGDKKVMHKTLRMLREGFVRPVKRCHNSGETCSTSIGSTAVASSSPPAKKPRMEEQLSPSGHSRAQSTVETDKGMIATSASHSNTSNREESLPKAAQEIDFGIFDPPSKPFVPESTEPDCVSLADVNDHDVLCFQGRRGFTNHVGNRRLFELVNDFLPVCSTADMREKRILARTIVLIVRKRGGRFLRKETRTGELFEFGDTKAEKKTTRMLREEVVRFETTAVEHGDAPGQISAEAERQNEQAAAQGNENTALCNAGGTIDRMLELNVAVRHAISEAGRVQDHFDDRGSCPLPEAGLVRLVTMSFERGGATVRTLAEAERENEQAAAQGDENTALCNAVGTIDRMVDLNVAVGHAISEPAISEIAISEPAISEAGRVQEHFGNHGDISVPLPGAEVTPYAKVYKNASVSHVNNDGLSSVAQQPIEQVGIPAAEGHGIGMDPFDLYCGFVESIKHKHKTHRTEHIRLKAELKCLREKHQASMLWIEKVEPSSDDCDDAHEEVEGRQLPIGGSTHLMGVVSIKAPTDISDKNYLKNFFAYLQELEAQNTDIEAENARLKAELNSRKEKYDDILKILKDLGKKSRQLARA